MLVSYKPFHRQFSPIVDEVLDGFFNNTVNRNSYKPAVNVVENEDGYVLHLVAPGLKKEDFKLNVDEGVLTISYEKPKEESELKFVLNEFAAHSFKRAFRLPETVNDEDINAAYESGILVLNLPKKEEAKPKPARTIEVA